MPKYEISFIGEEGIDGIYEGVISFEKNIFFIHAIEGEKKEGYIPLSSIKIMILIKEEVLEETESSIPLRRRL